MRGTSHTKFSVAALPDRLPPLCLPFTSVSSDSRCHVLQGALNHTGQLCQGALSHICQRVNLTAKLLRFSAPHRYFQSSPHTAHPRQLYLLSTILYCKSRWRWLKTAAPGEI